MFYGSFLKGAVGWSAVCDCVISWSYPRTFSNHLANRQRERERLLLYFDWVFVVACVSLPVYRYLFSHGAIGLLCVLWSWIVLVSLARLWLKLDMSYIYDLTWVLMFYWIYKTSFGKAIKCEACRKEFNKFNTTGARLLDYIYHMKLKLLKTRIFVVKTSIFCHLLRNVIMNIITQRY